eukprot:Tbor_TRINITY_DN2938_c0_g1::TRINITY_DN2938_c0_g1_i2::g.1087::m.1087
MHTRGSNKLNASMSSSTHKTTSAYPPLSPKSMYNAATEEERKRALQYAEWLVKTYHHDGDNNISTLSPRNLTNLSITSENCHKIKNGKSSASSSSYLETSTATLETPTKNRVTDSYTINNNGLNSSTHRSFLLSPQNESFQLGSAISSPNKPVVDYRIKTSSEINTTSDIHSVKCGQAVVAKHWDNGDMSPYIHSFKDVREGEALRELYRITLMQCAEQVFTAIAYELPRDHILLTMLDAQYQRKHKNTEECEESKAGKENGISTSSAVIPIPATTSQVSMRTAWLRVGEVIKEHLYSVQSLQYHCLLSDISVLRSQMEEHNDQVRRLEEENRALREDTEVQRMRMKEEGERMRAELLRRLEEENRALREETNVERMRMKEEGERMRAEHLLGTTRLAEELECLKQQNEKISRELDSVKKKWKFEVTYLDERASIISTCQNEFSQTLFSSWCLLKEKQHDESIKKTHKMYMDRFSLMQRSKEIFVEASEEVHKTALRHKETPVNSLNVSIARSIAPSLDYSSEWNVTSDYGDIGRVNSPPIEKLAKMSNRRKQSGS